MKRLRHFKSIKATPKERRRRQRYYLKDPDKAKARANAWWKAHRAWCLIRGAQYRKRRRVHLRRQAHLEAIKLTDSYIRNQLSKYSAYPTSHWTEAEIRARRRRIRQSRIKRLTDKKVKKIRLLYNKDERCVRSITRQFGVSESLIWQVVKNVIHHDPNYVMTRIQKPFALSRTLRMIDAASKIAKLTPP